MRNNKAVSWSARLSCSSGQASLETLLVAVALGAIILVPVTTEHHTLLELFELIVKAWMLVFSSTWQYFLLHPWVG